MTLVEHLFLPDTKPFAVAAAMIVVVGGVELLSMLLGFSLSELLGKAVHFEAEADSNVAHAMSWMNVNGVPLLIYITLLLAFFSMAGFLIQDAARNVAAPLPLIVATPLALLVALPFVRWSAGAIASAIPRDESYAVDVSTLVGRVGQVAVGPLDQGLPGRVTVKDEHDNFHTVPAVAAVDSPALSQGTEVLLVDRVDGRFIAIAAQEDITTRKSSV